MSEGPSDFTFPTLPKPTSQPMLPKQNPLLSRATVVDRTAPGQPGNPGMSSQAGAATVAARLPDGPNAPADSTMAPPRPRPRQKVLFEKGYSQVDWVRLAQKNPDLAGLKGQPRRRDITLEEVAQHNTENDAWTVLRGRVYNITPYLRFHPGGVPLLLKVAGKDGTVLFNKYHAWVNADFLLEKCLVGYLQQQPTPANGSSTEETSSMPPPPPVAQG